MRKAITVIFVLSFLHSFGQEEQEKLKASGNLQLTNNGISLFPNFTLGKPAAIVNLYVGKKNLSFEPEFRWGLNGEPWSYIFWIRYKIKRKKFGLNMGTHPAYILGNTLVGIDNQQENRWIAQRYVAGELVPIWYASDKFKLRLHYVTGRGLDPYAIRKSHFISLQPQFSSIAIGKDFKLGFFPQVFFLNLADINGTYISEFAELRFKELPITLSNVTTYKMSGEIAGDKFVWSVGLNFKF